MASVLSKFLIFFVLTWIFIYLMAYYVIMAPDLTTDNLKNKPGENMIEKESTLLNRRLLVHEPLLNPFQSEKCSQKFDFPEVASNSLSVIMVARNFPSPNDLVQSVKSVAATSGPILSEIIIVDDYSDVPLSEWPQWSFIDSNMRNKLKIVRTSSILGPSGSKHFGSMVAQQNKEVKFLLFSDDALIPLKSWLVSMTKILDLYPNSIVYPSVDIWTDNGFIKSDNVIGGFDWSLNFVWEALDSKRIPLLRNISDIEAPMTSPVAPRIIAITVDYYNRIGGFDRSLFVPYLDYIELSIRAWVCGGQVIKQPCSRVAARLRNVFSDSTWGSGISQAMVDFNVMAIAERYMTQLPSRIEYKESVFQARFLDRVPYSVEVTQSERFSKYLAGLDLMTKRQCQSFDWYLNEVYPGLREDRHKVQLMFQSHTSSNKYLESKLQPLLSQYAKRQSNVLVNVQELNDLTARSSTVDERAIQHHHDILIPKKVPYKEPQLTMAEYARNRAMKELEQRAHFEIKKKLQAFVSKNKEEPLNESISQNSQEESMPVPPQLPDEKQINETKTEERPPVLPDVKEETQIYQKEKKRLNINLSNDNLSSNANAEAPIVQLKAPIQRSEQYDEGIDPYLAQKQFSKGILPDPGSSPKELQENCNLNGRPNGEMLARFTLHTLSDLDKEGTRKFKIFCGIYTYEKNHATNVQATKETWAKRCDGFIAMSTKYDPSIPSINITHEGPEEYDNMWQKSRSIWKYVASRFIDDFDFFLLGGDDMFYIIENLRYYLGTDSAVIRGFDAGKGLFLGRRFYPSGGRVFNSGGAGYLLDKSALRILGSHLDGPPCFPHQKGFWEDVNVAHCLREVANIEPMDTRDMYERERFHPFQPGSHLTYRPPSPPAHDWYPEYNPYLKLGYECCSNDSVSFHYAPANDLRILFRYMYHCHRKEQTNLFGNI